MLCLCIVDEHLHFKSLRQVEEDFVLRGIGKENVSNVTRSSRSNNGDVFGKRNVSYD